MIRASNLLKLQGLHAHVRDNAAEWKTFFDSDAPFDATAPGSFSNLQVKLNSFIQCKK